MRTFARLILVTLIVAPVAYWIMASGSDGNVAAQPMQVQPSFSAELSCDRASWYNAPTGDGRRAFVPSYSGFYDNSVAAWSAMTDAERGAFLAQCGEVQP